jgi:hypothetical protein
MESATTRYKPFEWVVKQWEIMCVAVDELMKRHFYFTFSKYTI